MFHLSFRTIVFFATVGIVSAAVPDPPVLIRREAVRQPDLPGLSTALDTNTSTTFTLFLPEEISSNDDGTTTLTVHFHGTAWFVEQEHLERGATNPLLVANADEGDAVYETDIMKPGVWDDIVSQTDRLMSESSGTEDVQLGQIEVSSFSAGYAGVRGMLRLPTVEPHIATVLLGDSLYVGDAPDRKTGEPRVPRPGEDGIGPFIDFARKAKAGERKLLMEFSDAPSKRSVGPMDCALAVMDALEMGQQLVKPDSIPASRRTADYQLSWRADSGNAHFWSYRSEGAPIHLAHLRNQSSMWRTIDGNGDLLAAPPIMSVRPIHPWESLPGEMIPVDFSPTGTVTLFVPKGYQVPEDGAVELNVHFHGAAWFAIQEHLDRGMGEPLVIFELGQGSSVYRVPFEDQSLFGEFTDTVCKLLIERGAPPTTQVGSVNITSFSAGYGAVREIVKNPEYIALIERIVLGDSSYGSLAEAPVGTEERVVAPEHVEPWLAYARLAMSGEKTLLMLTSDIQPDTYAGTFEVARAVSERLAVEAVPVAPDAIPAAGSDQPYPLYTRADSGSFHWWAYRGHDAVVHMTLARHIADAWIALDHNGDS